MECGTLVPQMLGERSSRRKQSLPTPKLGSPIGQGRGIPKTHVAAPASESGERGRVQERKLGAFFSRLEMWYT